MSRTQKIVIALLLGFFSGFFFGERMAVLAVFGEIFVGLLQMTVLPYIIVALISSIGTLTAKRAKALQKYGIGVLAGLWLITFLVMAIAAISFPDWESASYFNPSLLQVKESSGILSEFLPTNIFASLGAGAVPAVVVFSILFGVALINYDNKQSFLENINTMQNVIARISQLIMRTAPFGVFAITANAAGTLNIEDLKGLYVYLSTLSLVCVLLTFWFYPTLVKQMVPQRYREVIKTSKNALIIAFTTGSLFVVLPIIIENVRKIYQSESGEDTPESQLVEVIIPAAYALPVAGKLMAILFVLFAGWFSGETIEIQNYPALFGVGLIKLFGSNYSAVPDLLYLNHVPVETYGLFLVGENILSNRLGAMCSVMFMVVLAILTVSGISGRWRWQPKRVAKIGVASILAMFLMTGTLRWIYGAIGHDYTGYAEFIERDLILPQVKSRVLKKLPEYLPIEEGSTALDRIKNRKKLRFGYYRDWLPYAFHNQEGKLVGLDIEVAHQIARDMGVAVEFVRVYRKDLAQLLESGYLDMASGVAVTPSAVSRYTLTRPHANETLALLVEQSMRHQARKWNTIEEDGELQLGVVNTYYLTHALQSKLPDLNVVEIASPRTFLKGEDDDIQGVIAGAASASAWTLLYPEFDVVVPQPALPNMPMAMPVATDDNKFYLFTSQLIEMYINDGTIEKLNSYWIQGEKLYKKTQRRWNIWDDVIMASVNDVEE